MSTRFSDDALKDFHQEFLQHLEAEKMEREQQRQLFEAVFRQEDEAMGTPPGLLQMMSRMEKQLKTVQEWQSKQRTFISGVVFAVSSIGFLFTDTSHKLFIFLRGL